MTWNLNAPANAAVFTTRRVMEGQSRVVRVICDDEGDWQALDAAVRGEGDAVLISLASLVELHPYLYDVIRFLADREWGFQATEHGGEWRLDPFVSD